MTRAKGISLMALFCILTTYSNAKDKYLEHFPKGKTPQEVGEGIAARFLITPHSNYGNPKPDKPYKNITYPEVCTWLGALWFAKETGNENLLNQLQERFEPLFNKEKHLQPEPIHVDNNVFGALALELYLQTNEKKYCNLGLYYADSQWKLPTKIISEKINPKEAKAWSDKGFSWQTRIWIDDMFMITALQSQAYKATGERKYIDRAAAEMNLYLDKIQLDNGLFYHAPQAPFSWGRGNGWMAVGMTELLRNLPKDNPHYARIMLGYRKMMAALINHQSRVGMWHQIIDDVDTWKEPSGSAMFTYALITGVKEGWIDGNEYSLSARKGWLALTEYLNENFEMKEICAGTKAKNDKEFYKNRKRRTGDLHGQAPMLWCAAALLR